jgi:uncharacterized protein YdeI (YjbR/CyaY-like superfamily)
MKPVFFRSPDDFRKWLEKNHLIKTELIVGFYKVKTGKPSMTWSQSVDQALCFGWIDGVRKSIDDTRYQIRFTPRKASTIWSSVNVKKVADLTKQGLMHEAGLASFNKRTAARSGIYSHEKTESSFSPGFEKIFRANKKAWAYFQALASSYRKTSIHWVMSAKQEATKEKRLKSLIADSEAGTNQWKNNKYMKK